MTKVERHLITTADERTWKFDQPVLFLNEFCKIYDRTSIWKDLDALVAEPFELEPEKQKKNITYLQKLTSQIIIELSDALNSIHNVEHSDRYWSILIGPWIERYLCIVFDRYFAIDHATRTHELSATTILEVPEYNLATKDSWNAIWACNDDMWNHVLCSRILKFLNNVPIETKPIKLRPASLFNLADNQSHGWKSGLKKVSISIFKDILPLLSRESDAFITNSYLPRWRELGLHLLFRQFPQVWQSSPLKEITYNSNMRKHIEIGNHKYSGFEHFVRLQLPETIPICYLEGYKSLSQQVEELPWPSSPEFIFTSNKFDTDEIFKAWTALKVEQGSPYFIGQHGANYGTFFSSENSLIMHTCDKFLTWGWTHSNPKNIPAFNFKIAGMNKPEISKNGGLLLIELPPLHRSGLANINAQNSNFIKYQEEQFIFVESLPENIRKQLTVRLHAEWKKHRWSDEMRWIDRSPFVRIEKGLSPLQDLISKNRLIVHSYDSTGILETLALNIPTICFWYDGLDHISEKAKPYYELLRGVGILHDSPNQAAESIALHWDNIDAWWSSERVQHARQLFCNEYARTEKHPVKKLKQLLSEAVLSHDDQTNIRRSKSSSN